MPSPCLHAALPWPTNASLTLGRELTTGRLVPTSTKVQHCLVLAFPLVPSPSWPLQSALWHICCGHCQNSTQADRADWQKDCATCPIESVGLTSKETCKGLCCKISTFASPPEHTELCARRGCLNLTLTHLVCFHSPTTERMRHG